MTLRCIAGIHRPTSGSVILGGHDIVRDPVGAKRLLAYVADEPHLFEHLTVMEHLRLTGRIYGVAGADARARTLLEELELGDREKSLPAELSRGMKQKVTLACAFMHDPSALLLDEPLTGLDPLGIHRMKQTIVSHAHGGGAVIVSSHLLHLVEEICTRVLIINRGVKVADGTLADLAAQARIPGSTLNAFSWTSPGPGREMTSAFVYLATCSIRNSVRLRLRRLRQPRYLLIGLGMLIYLANAIFNRPPDRLLLDRSGPSPERGGDRWSRAACVDPDLEVFWWSALRNSRFRKCSSCFRTRQPAAADPVQAVANRDDRVQHGSAACADRRTAACRAGRHFHQPRFRDHGDARVLRGGRVELNTSRVSKTAIRWKGRLACAPC